MTLLAALILGIVQGLTEFIPVSSTAHLTIAGKMLGVIDPAHPERWTAFMATIQLGTLVAVVAYFMRDVMGMTRSFLTENIGNGKRPFAQQSLHARLAWWVVLGSIPIATIGMLLKKVIEGQFTKDLNVIACSLIIVAVLLGIAERMASFKRRLSDMNAVDAVGIGLAQTLALIPGSSRSGTTIMAGLFRGFTREDAARFSFLLSLPAILGAGVLEFVKEMKHLSWADGGMQLLAATIAAGVFGYWSIAFLLKFLRTRTLMPFLLYRIALGVMILLTGCSPEQEKLPASIDKPMEKMDQRKLPAIASDTIAQDTAVITDAVSIRTSKGTIVVGLYGIDAPQTVHNFVALARRGFYNGVLFHRVARNLVIQAGDPRTKDPSARMEWGKGGATADGKPLPEELNPAAPSAKDGYVKGVLAMARKQQPNTGTSQFFICLDQATSFPYQYTIFGRVIKGLDVVDAIGSVEVEPGPLGETDGMPRQPIAIQSAKVLSR